MIYMFKSIQEIWRQMEIQRQRQAAEERYRQERLLDVTDKGWEYLSGIKENTIMELSSPKEFLEKYNLKVIR